MTSRNGIIYEGPYKWYQKYKFDPEEPETAALELTKPAYVLGRDIPGASSAFKNFCGFPDQQSMLDYIGSYTDYPSFYEYLLPHQGERKFYFDIDDDTSGRSEMNDKLYMRFLADMTTTIGKMFAEIDLPYDHTHYRIYQSHGMKPCKGGLPVFKYSFHYVITGYRSTSHEQTKSFCGEVIKRMAQLTEQYYIAQQPTLPKEQPIDTAPYNSMQAFRLLGSSKHGSNRPKVLMNYSGQANMYTVVNSEHDFCHYPVPSEAVVWPEMRDSLILNPWKTVQVPATFYPPPVKGRSNFSSDSLEGQRLETALAHLEEMHPSLKGVYECDHSTPGRIKRIAPGLCPTCNVIHEGENAYIHVRRNGTVSFYCLRAERSLPVDGLVFAAENDKNSKDEEDDEPIIIPLTSRAEFEKAVAIDRSYNCKHSRLAYRETDLGKNVYAVNSKSENMERPLTSFAEDIPPGFVADPYAPTANVEYTLSQEGHVQRPLCWATLNITIVEKLVEVAGKIALQYKLYGGNVVRFATCTPVKDVQVNFSYTNPDTGKIIRDNIYVSSLLYGSFIRCPKYSGGSIPDMFVGPARTRIYDSIECRRNTAERKHRKFSVFLALTTTTPYFRHFPAPLESPNHVNIFGGFKADPYRYLYYGNKARNQQMAFPQFRYHPLLRNLYILVFYGLSGGVYSDAENIMDFAAFPFLNLHCPKTQKCLTIIGDYGCGKSTFGQALVAIYGVLGLNTNIQRVTSKFNGALANCIFAMLDEPETGGSEASPARKREMDDYMSRFKEFITAEEIQMEEKYQKEHKRKMNVNFYLSTNNYDIGILDISDERQCRRPIVLEARTCCMQPNPSGGVPFYYFYANGEMNRCVDIEGKLLSPHPSPEEIRRDKNAFYSQLNADRAHPDFDSLFAASLLAWGDSDGNEVKPFQDRTRRIINYVQPADHPTVVKIRSMKTTNPSRFMAALCGPDFRLKQRDIPESLQKFGRKSLKPYMRQNQDGIMPTCYYIHPDDLYKMYKAWHIEFVSDRPLSISTFERQFKIHAARHPESISICAKDKSGDHRACFPDPMKPGKYMKLNGYCFLTFSDFKGTITNVGEEGDEGAAVVNQQPQQQTFPQWQQTVTQQPQLQPVAQAPVPQPQPVTQGPERILFPEQENVGKLGLGLPTVPYQVGVNGQRLEVRAPVSEPEQITKLPANKPYFVVPLIDDREKKRDEEICELREQLKQQTQMVQQLMQMMMQQRT